jgi:hypothetical protein
VSIYPIHEHHITHTCPIDPEPHVIETRRRILHITPGGPCQNPITIRCGGMETVVDCRHEPYKRQCPACRTVVITVKTTVIHLGWDEPTGASTAPSGKATEPCTFCGQPLDAVLAPLGHHLGCPPDPTAQDPA